MERAGYLRNQALMCLEIAWQASDPDTAETLRVAGLRYFEQAVEVEKQKCFDSLTNHYSPLVYPSQTRVGRSVQ
jgi:hypothetical protein